MKANARTHAFDLRRIAVLAAVALVVGLAAGCGASGGSGGSSQSAGDFIRQVTTQFSRGQAGPLWDSLHPADQAVVGRLRYMACQSNSGFDLVKLKVLQTYADTVDVAGRPTASTAVSVRVNSDDGVTTATMHAVEVNGKWRWILSARDYAAYKNGKCPSSA
jgi:hypothetical protein